MSQYLCALRTSATANGRKTHRSACNNSGACTGASQRYITVRPSVYIIMPSHAPQLCPQLSRTNNKFSGPEDRHKKCGPSSYYTEAAGPTICLCLIEGRGGEDRGTERHKETATCLLQPCIWMGGLSQNIWCNALIHLPALDNRVWDYRERRNGRLERVV